MALDQEALQALRGARTTTIAATSGDAARAAGGTWLPPWRRC
jgi:hypothetical protein